MKANTSRLPRGDEWVYEPKWDGHRLLVRVHGDHVDAISSTAKPRLPQWPWLAGVADALGNPAGTWVVDGEVVAMDDSGRHKFEYVGRPDRAHVLVVFDLLVADGVDLQAEPWHERRALLDASFHSSPEMFVTPVSEDADALMAATLANGFEGVVAKRRGSSYQAGRRAPSWVKVKHRMEQEVVVGGFLAGGGNRSLLFGSLLVGVYEGGALRFSGGVGTGFTEATLTMLRDQLRSRITTTCPFDPEPKLPRGRATWVRPELVAQVAFMEWTEYGHLRHPVYLGLRDDKAPGDVVREA